MRSVERTKKKKKERIKKKKNDISISISVNGRRGKERNDTSKEEREREREGNENKKKTISKVKETPRKSFSSFLHSAADLKKFCFFFPNRRSRSLFQRALTNAVISFLSMSIPTCI